MDDEATLFHDHSTLDGRLSLFLHRINWKYVIPPALFLAAFVGFALLMASIDSEMSIRASNTSTLRSIGPDPGSVQLAPGNLLLGDGEDPSVHNIADGGTDDEEEEIHGWTVIKQPKPGFVEAEGCENGLYAFEGFDNTVEPSSAKSLRVRNLVIDAPSLSHSLAEWTSLEDLVIENVWTNGNFSRAYLPSLKKFIYHQYRNGKTDQYKQQDVLKQTLFFDTSPTSSWDLNKDLLNLNITVQVTIEGTKILDIEPTYGEININTHECQDMFQNFQPEKAFNLTTLSLSWCPLGAPFLEKIKEVAGTLKYLFLNNAVPGSTAELSQVTSTLRNLRELHIFQRFHCDWPGYEIYLNVSDLSPFLETLSVTNLDISYVEGVGAPSVRNLSLDQYVGKNLVDNFDKIFPNVQTVALFNVTQNLSHALLEKIIDTIKPEVVIVTDLKRNLPPGTAQQEEEQNMKSKNKSSKRSNKKNNGSVASKDDDATAKVEKLLSIFGVPASATSFLLELNKGSNNGTYYAGKELTSFQRNYYRFIRLAFKKIDTYTDYVIWDADPK